MVGEDLFELARSFGCDALQPVEKPLVQFGAQLLRHRAVCSVAKQYVCESIPVVTRKLSAIGAHELLVHERQKDGADVGPHVRWDQLGDRAAMEETAFHRGALHHRPFWWRERIEARRE